MTKSQETEIAELKTKIDYLTRDVWEIKNEVWAVHAKLNDNSTKIFDYILQHTERMEEKYISKESFKMWLGAVSTALTIVITLITFVLNKVF